MTKENETNSKIRLHDLWSLRTIKGEDVKLVDEGSRPLMELFIEEMKIRGNAGCNQINGNISLVNNSEIKFERIAATKMMCPDMKVEQAYMSSLRECTNYILKDLTLYFRDANGKELLTFRKVD